MKNYYVYMMTNKSRATLYIGVTNDLMRRVYEHKNNLVDGFTKKYNINQLVYYESTTNIESAILREKQLKKWTRKKKEVLVDSFNREWVDLYGSII